MTNTMNLARMKMNLDSIESTKKKISIRMIGERARWSSTWAFISCRLTGGSLDISPYVSHIFIYILFMVSAPGTNNWEQHSSLIDASRQILSKGIQIVPIVPPALIFHFLEKKSHLMNVHILRRITCNKKLLSRTNSVACSVFKSLFGARGV